MAGSVHIPWYATGFRADALEEALGEIAPLAIRYGATGYSVFRYRDDRYKFLQTATFENKLEWERYWSGEDFVRWRAKYSSWYQVPVLYQWADITVEGHLPSDPGYGGEPASVHGGMESGEIGDSI
jgi:hypothetical protein